MNGCSAHKQSRMHIHASMIRLRDCLWLNCYEVFSDFCILVYFYPKAWYYEKDVPLMAGVLLSYAGKRCNQRFI